MCITRNWLLVALLSLHVGAANGDDCGSCEKAFCGQCTCLAGTFATAGGPDGTGHVTCDECPAGSYAREYTWDMVFQGECTGTELRMYDGGDSGDNPGTNNLRRVTACARACLAKKEPNNNVSWVSLFCNACYIGLTRVAHRLGVVTDLYLCSMSVCVLCVYTCGLVNPSMVPFCLVSFLYLHSYRF
jgi:hypothetical protein